MLENIPEILRKTPRWILWEYRHKPGKAKPTKVPISPRTGALASATDANNWVPFEEALAAQEKLAADGVGFVFNGDGIIGLDLDDCYQEGLGFTTPFAAKCAQQLYSYTEVSPSGKGVKVFMRGELPESRGFGAGDGLYGDGRFFTVTGNTVVNTDVNPVPKETLEALIEEVAPRPRIQSDTVPIATERMLDEEVIRRAETAKNGDKFRPLWNGNHREYTSQSNADAALISLLAFYTGPCPEQLDRLFRRSGLMRDKWDAPARRGETYGEGTIREVLSSMGHGDFYVVRGAVPLPRGVTQQEPHWEQRLLKNRALSLNERPHLLAILRDHVAPMGVRLGDDWLDTMCLAALSTMFPGVRYQNLSLNLWALGVSKQGVGKSLVGRELSEIAYRVAHLRGEMLLRYGSGSAAGLIRVLAGTGRQALAFFSEWSGFSASMGAEYNASMREVLMDLYDGTSVTHQLASERIVVSEPIVSLMATTTPRGFVSSADIGDAANGFYSRLWFCAPDTTPGELHFREEHEQPPVVRAVVEHLLRLPEFSRVEGNEELLDVYSREDGSHKLEDALLTGTSALPAGRLMARAKKVATILELCEESPRVSQVTLRIRDENMTRALRLVERGAAYGERVLGWLSRSKDDERATRVLRALRGGPRSLLDILRACYLNADEARAATRLLLAEGLIASEFRGAREVFSLTGGEHATK